MDNEIHTAEFITRSLGRPLIKPYMKIFLTNWLHALVDGDRRLILSNYGFVIREDELLPILGYNLLEFVRQLVEENKCDFLECPRLFMVVIEHISSRRVRNIIIDEDSDEVLIEWMPEK
jgi:hypothetical protein